MTVNIEVRTEDFGRGRGGQQHAAQGQEEKETLITLIRGSKVTPERQMETSCDQCPRTTVCLWAMLLLWVRAVSKSLCRDDLFQPHMFTNMTDFSAHDFPFSNEGISLHQWLWTEHQLHPLLRWC